jgi:hypothetical protein
MNCDMGACPTGQHITDFRQCGFSGCVDLRQWAKTHRYRYQLGERSPIKSSPIRTLKATADGLWR